MGAYAQLDESFWTDYHTFGLVGPPCSFSMPILFNPSSPSTALNECMSRSSSISRGPFDLGCRSHFAPAAVLSC